MQPLAVHTARPVAKSEDLAQAGDFVVVPKRPLNWPAYDAVIFSCPYCGGPLATMPEHLIVSKEPLTIEGTIACPYSAHDKSYTAVKVKPPRGFLKRAWWRMFGEKTRLVEKSNPHAFTVKAGTISPA